MLCGQSLNYTQETQQYSLTTNFHLSFLHNFSWELNLNPKVWQKVVWVTSGPEGQEGEGALMLTKFSSWNVIFFSYESKTVKGLFEIIHLKGAEKGSLKF